MIKLLPIVALLVAVASAGTFPAHLGFGARLSGRVIGGEETTIEENPHQVSIRYDNGHYCGGSIVSEYWVVTAGHCLGGILDHYTILAGTADKFNANRTGSVHTVDGIINHPRFTVNKYGTLVNDVALLHVLEPFHFDETRQPVELFKSGEETTVGSTAVITGWGTNGKFAPQILNRVEVPIIPKDTCNQQYVHLGGVPAGQICAAYEEGGKDACQGDSGGPLTVGHRLAGIVSWGQGCAVAGHPGVYTEIAYFRDWIKSVISF